MLVDIDAHSLSPANQPQHNRPVFLVLYLHTCCVCPNCMNVDSCCRHFSASEFMGGGGGRNCVALPMFDGGGGEMWCEWFLVDT